MRQARRRRAAGFQLAGKEHSNDGLSVARKPIELPPAAARRFVEDMRAFHAEKNGVKADGIAARQLHAS
jgi:hypothetical protein